MHRLFAALALAFALAACSGAPRMHAHPDPALDALFTQLEAAPDAATSAQIEARIWAHWAQSGSPTVDILMDRAQTAERSGDAELAIRFLEQASDLAPDFAEPWDRRANLAYRARDYAGAISAIQETLKREPRHFGALTGLGMIREELGQNRAALEAYRAALAINPHYDLALRGVGRLQPKVDGRDA